MTRRRRPPFAPCSYPRSTGRRGTPRQMTTRTGLADDANELRVALASDAAFEAWYAATVPRVYAYVFSRSGRDTGLPRRSPNWRLSPPPSSGRASTVGPTPEPIEKSRILERSHQVIRSYR